MPGRCHLRACLRQRRIPGDIDVVAVEFLNAGRNLDAVRVDPGTTTDSVSRVNGWRTHAEIPARTAESDALSRELRRLGFSFVGSTICYAFMQATGLVNDHTIGCFRYAALR